MNTFTKVGLDALLTPENCAVLLIDHQPSQLANVNSDEPTMVIRTRSASRKSPQNSLFPPKNRPITLLSRRVRICRLSTRSLHNLLHLISTASAGRPEADVSNPVTVRFRQFGQAPMNGSRVRTRP